MAVTYNCLKQQNSETSNAIIAHFTSETTSASTSALLFQSLSSSEGALIRQRDEEDGQKLQKGIDLALEKGVLSKDFVPEPYITVDVLGKSANEVADEILGHVAANAESDSKIIVLVGQSGTGKGTTVATLCEKLLLNGEPSSVQCWSNGNIFRSVTLLAATWCEQNCEDKAFDPSRALTKENLSSFMDMLEFGNFKGKYDTRINGLGLDMYVSEVANTELKVPKVAKNIPTVAEVTQGEVIIFAAKAIRVLGNNGITVLLEGREETVNYVRSKNRFCLVLSDESLIGMRRAAQRIMAAALPTLTDSSSEDDVQHALEASLENMTKNT